MKSLHFKTVAAALIAIGLLSSVSHSGTITPGTDTTTFTDQSRPSRADLNTNFNVIIDEHNANDTRITEAEAAIASGTGGGGGVAGATTAQVALIDANTTRSLDNVTNITTNTSNITNVASAAFAGIGVNTTKLNSQINYMIAGVAGVANVADPRGQVSSVRGANQALFTGSDNSLWNATGTDVNDWVRVSGQGAYWEGVTAITFGTPGPTHTLTTGFNSVPSIVTTYLECLTDNTGYVQGDHVMVSSSNNLSVGSTGFSLIFDGSAANDVTVRIGTGDMYLIHKTTGTETRITNANWQLRIKAWK